MSKIKTSKIKLIRRIGIDIWNKKIDHKKVKSRPGEHPKLKFKQTIYGNQLKSKQILRYFYGVINERQFKNLYFKAAENKRNIMHFFLSLLERRLQTFLFRCGLAKTIFQSRQIINHGHVLVNGKKMNVKSHILKVGDVVSLTEKSMGNDKFFKFIIKENVNVPKYISRESEGFKLNQNPTMEQIVLPFKINLDEVSSYYTR